MCNVQHDSIGSRDIIHANDSGHELRYSMCNLQHASNGSKDSVQANVSGH